MMTAKAAGSAINSENISTGQTLDLMVELDIGLGGVESSFLRPIFCRRQRKMNFTKVSCMHPQGTMNVMTCGECDLLVAVEGRGSANPHRFTPLPLVIINVV